MSLERELELHEVEELLAPKDEPQDVEKSQADKNRVVETAHVYPSTRDGWKHTREAVRLFLDARDNVGAPTSQRR